MIESDTKFLLPSGDGNTQIAIDLEEIAKSEQRLKDVAIVNSFTAPEMLSTFNDIWLKLNKSVTLLTYQKNIADNSYRRNKAEAKLSCTDEAIRKRGHTKSSADLREAVVELDENVQRAKDRLDKLSFVLDILRGKQEAFLNAYNSVKRLTGGSSLPQRSYGDANRPEPYQDTRSQQSYDLNSPNRPDLEEPLPQGFKGF